jgi:signal transduction histidine kinase
LAFNVEVAPSVGHVVGDARRLRESVEHLLRNAITYTDEGSVGLTVTGTDDEVRVSVTDTGPGIAPGDQVQVFDRFHRVGGAHRGGDAALGLGLPLTRQFIEAHGGKVELASNLGKGTTVTFTVPRAAV